MQPDPPAHLLDDGYYRAIFNHAPTSICMNLPDGKLIRTNQAWIDFIGYDADELVNLHWSEITNPDDIEKDATMVRDLIEGRTSASHLEKRYIRKDGKQVWGLLHLNLIRDDQGEPAFFVAQIIDITDIKEAEAALCRARDEQTRQAERLSKLNAELDAARQAAEAANFNKSEFLAQMSHELRTPLNSILGFNELIRDELHGPLGADIYQEYATYIGESAQHLMTMINDLLDFSKIEAGKMQVHPEPISLPAMLQSVITFTRGYAQEYRMAVELDIAPGIDSIHADPRAGKQILINLVSNAIKYSEEGNQVRIEARRNGTDDGTCIAVIDNGVGMTDDQIRLALEPFEQVHSELSRKREGTGLGMPLARELTLLHGGGFHITSQPGEGTRIEVCFPDADPA